MMVHRAWGRRRWWGKSPRASCGDGGEKSFPCESRDTSNRSHFHHPVRHEATVVIFVSAHYSACASSYYCRERGLGGSELPRVPFASTTLSPLPRQLSTYPPTPPLLSWILERRSAPVPLLPRIGRAPASTGGRGQPSGPSSMLTGPLGRTPRSLQQRLPPPVPLYGLFLFTKPPRGHQTQSEGTEQILSGSWYIDELTLIRADPQ